MARIEVITGPERRRRWSENQKRAIIAASFAPGAVVSDIARRADVCPGQIYRWRKELRAAPAGFAEMLIAPAATVASDAGVRSACCSEPAIEIEFAGTASVRVPASIPAGLAAAVVRALSER